jgi:hypothetical protein
MDGERSPWEIQRALLDRGLSAVQVDILMDEIQRLQGWRLGRQAREVLVRGALKVWLGLVLAGVGGLLLRAGQPHGWTALALACPLLLAGLGQAARGGLHRHDRRPRPRLVVREIRLT